MESVLSIVFGALVLLAVGFFLVFVPSLASLSVALIVFGLALMFGLGVHAGRNLSAKDIDGHAK